MLLALQKIFTYMHLGYDIVHQPSKNECVENHMGVVLNTSTWNFVDHLQFTNVSKIKVTGVIWAHDVI